VNEVFQYEVEELKRILDSLKDFVVSNNKTIRCTEYYIALDNKNFLQVLEDTFNDSTLNENLKKEHLKLIKIFLEKQKNLYHKLCFESNAQSLDLKSRFEDVLMFLGFSENKNNLFSNLENTINRIDIKEIVQ
jgi:hypothetical protein